MSTLDIKLQGRNYSVACPPEEREALLAAVAFLDAQMTDLAQKTKSTGERLAVMTALNMAHELIALKKAPAAAPATVDQAQGFDAPDLRRRIQAMEVRLDEAMAQQDDLF